jgi:HEPN domain-containing protein
VNIVGQWLEETRRDLLAAAGCLAEKTVVPDRAAFHVQQASEKLVKAALVAHEIRPSRTHDIGEIADALPERFPLKAKFVALDRFSEYAVILRYPGERRPAIPSVGKVRTWIEEIEVLKAEFEHWLRTRNQDTK